MEDPDALRREIGGFLRRRGGFLQHLFKQKGLKNPNPSREGKKKGRVPKKGRLKRERERDSYIQRRSAIYKGGGVLLLLHFFFYFAFFEDTNHAHGLIWKYLASPQTSFFRVCNWNGKGDWCLIHFGMKKVHDANGKGIRKRMNECMPWGTTSGAHLDSVYKYLIFDG